MSCMTKHSITIVALLALALTGCMTSGSGYYSTGYADSPYPGRAAAGATAQLARPVSAAQALVILPDQAGNVLTVVERRSDEVVAQEIAYEADASALGENRIRIAMGRLNGGDPVLAPVIAPARASEINAEIRAEFPGMDMRVSEVVARNPYGTFGYASGTKGRYGCIYAWQFITGLGEPSNMMGGMFTVSHSAALRIRLCRADVPVERLLKYVEVMRMTVPTRGAAISYPVDMPVGDDALGAVYPTY